MVSYSTPYSVNIRFCQQKSYCTFLHAKMHTLLVRSLRTKSDIRTTNTVKHHANIQADKNFLSKMLASKKRRNPDKNVYCEQRP